MTSICPLPFANNATVVASPYFADWNWGANSIISNGTEIISITANVPSVTGRVLSKFYVGTNSSVAHCSSFVSSDVDTTSCEYTITLTGAWTEKGLRSCPGWQTVAVGDTVTLSNYAFLEWTDIMDGLTGNTRTHRTSLRIRLNQTRDVAIEAAAQLAMDPSRIVISRVVYVPGDVGAGHARFEMDYKLIAPCPMAPVLRSVTFAQASLTSANIFSATNSSINVTGNGLTFTVAQAGQYQTPLIPYEDKACDPKQTNYIVTGTLFVNASKTCFADADYYFNFQHISWVWNDQFGGWAEISSWGPAFTVKATIDNEFNYCALETFNATLSASLAPVGAGPWTIGDKVTFHGNVTTHGLPAAQIYLRQATVYNTKAEFNATRYPKPVFASATAAYSTFGAATAFKSKFISDYYNGGNVEVGNWSIGHLKENTNSLTYPANTPRPYLAQVSVIGGTALSSSYIVPSDYDDVGLGFALSLTWRVYFDLESAVTPGQTKRRYQTLRDVNVQMETLRQAKAFARASLFVERAPVSNTVAVPSSSFSIGAIVGLAVAGVALMVGIAIVAALIVRITHKNSRTVRADSESGIFMTQ